MIGGMAGQMRPLSRMPVSIPDDMEDRTLPKATGVVKLPAHIAWSPPYTYDLDFFAPHPNDVTQLYEAARAALEADGLKVTPWRTFAKTRALDHQ